MQNLPNADCNEEEEMTRKRKKNKCEYEWNWKMPSLLSVDYDEEEDRYDCEQIARDNNDEEVWYGSTSC